MTSMNLKIITPNKSFYSGEILKLATETERGSLGILPNHIAMIVLLKPTITKFISIEGKEYKAFTSTGVLKINNNNMEFLCESCEWPEEIDIVRAEKAKERAEKRLAEKNESVDIKRAEKALLKAITRMGMKK